MTTVDSTKFLANGGYLQKGREKNLRPVDLGRKTLSLAPSRYAIIGAVSQHLMNLWGSFHLV
ncbi:uncharacterized protein Z520_01425 [Fonsecaea multimorphosa CBS 102226]|uniref:Uncharacterized protein n=1 Tax=Fonsecaea multimorphosa CBS 102226 TaxID=1442371 RepID=A0A0D2KHQ1_9EURO|nr:uncharacterized protein Z520_01425 [Fonsecaea multimorphosa CBS 102226]KIY02960.1 hypothetical protein Z520_01425 [Fonsecaea multimorphosa CBS 102226]